MSSDRSDDGGASSAIKGDGFLVVGLNPVIQHTLVFNRLAKGEVNRSSEHRVDASGKAVNVARVLGESGQRAQVLCQLGGPSRDWFLSMCREDSIDLIWVESGSEIRTCTTVIDKVEQSVTELVEEAFPVNSGTGERVLAAYKAALPDHGTVIFSGTRAAGFPDDIIPTMVGLAAEAGKKLILDIKGKDLISSLPQRPLAVKPNLEELASSFALPSNFGSEDEIKDFVAARGREYAERWGTSLIVTRGSKPTLYWDRGRIHEVPVMHVTALNPIGSGDAFTAGLASILARGGNLAEAVAEGTRLGALNAERLKPGSTV